ncbi:uncharacterized protein [Eurosta solidaginis]|uniref:uncharacterized protein n=1 Tax=Eurosta solidaginis TaxID=178769 RepID=UPI003530FA09
MDSYIEMIEVNLNSPNTPTTPSTMDKHFDQATGAIQKNSPVVNARERGDRGKVLEEVLMRHKRAHPTEDDSKPHLRYFAVGPSTYQIRCPLCKQRADTETVQISGILGQLSCLLSALSCCFPIFTLSFVYVCLQSRLKSKRMFCNKCGGHLGFFWRPT